MFLCICCLKERLKPSFYEVQGIQFLSRKVSTAIREMGPGMLPGCESQPFFAELILVSSYRRHIPLSKAVVIMSSGTRHQNRGWSILFRSLVTVLIMWIMRLGISVLAEKDCMHGWRAVRETVEAPGMPLGCREDWKSLLTLSFIAPYVLIGFQTT